MELTAPSEAAIELSVSILLKEKDEEIEVFTFNEEKPNLDDNSY